MWIEEGFSRKRPRAIFAKANWCLVLDPLAEANGK